MLDDRQRTGRDGNFMRLTEGKTFFRIDGPNDGRPLVLIHGATVPHWEFDAIAPFLVEAGFCVYRFDLFGHGQSDRPRGRYDLGRFVRQAQEFVQAIEVDAEELVVWGHSMGAAVAAALIERLPKNPAGLVLMAPMWDFSAVNPYATVLRLPIAGDALMTLFGRRALRDRRRRRYSAIGRMDLIARFNEQAGRPGFWRALLSMERHGALGNQRSAYESAARRGVAPIVIHGSADAIVPRCDVERIVALFGAARQIELDGLEHNLMLAEPAAVSCAVVECLPRATWQAPDQSL
jgi:pimeloyl-ACP methyl ester carboxylesterase